MPASINVGAINTILRGTNGPIAVRLMRSGVNVQSRAKRQCPVDTGRLRSSIQTTSPEVRNEALVVRIGSNVNYARYVECGTEHMSARPYLRPALEREVG